MKIDARNLDFKELNKRIREAVKDGEKNIALENVNGQRYIGCGLAGNIEINIQGVGGNDLGAFMDGPRINVQGNLQDAAGNTMNQGEITVHGNAGDVLGYGMRGGRVYVRRDIGYRVGIHMKSYEENYPVIVAGGEAGDFLGEYMAGGILIVLGIDKDKPVSGEYIGTGMHGGEIYLRGEVEDYQLGEEVKAEKVDEKDMEKIRPFIQEYAGRFETNVEEILEGDFMKLWPYSHRPYGKIYSY